ncbi:MAG TPA: zinc ribbon domain-containing protein [Blastocatellia bacterium]|jgi:hypothetical protein|nr:zinc ribbon domain-containing protein [Blastocatellia bacterium]
MFCPSCGFEYTQKTNYCKRCGEELIAAPQSVEIKPQRFQAIGMPFVVVGFLGIVGLFMNLLSYHVLLSRHDVSPPDAFLSLALGLLFVGGIAGFLIRQLSRLITAQQKSNQAPAQERVIIREAQVPRLGMTNDPVQGIVEPSSVVEHTTRQMAGVYGEPKATK